MSRRAMRYIREARGYKRVVPSWYVEPRKPRGWRAVTRAAFRTAGRQATRGDIAEVKLNLRAYPLQTLLRMMLRPPESSLLATWPVDGAGEWWEADEDAVGMDQQPNRRADWRLLQALDVEGAVTISEVAAVGKAAV